MLKEQRRQWWKGLKRLPSLKRLKGNAQGAEAIRVESPKTPTKPKTPKGQCLMSRGDNGGKAMLSQVVTDYVCKQRK